jgi:hypothetical protein
VAVWIFFTVAAGRVFANSAGSVASLSSQIPGFACTADDDSAVCLLDASIETPNIVRGASMFGESVANLGGAPLPPFPSLRLPVILVVSSSPLLLWLFIWDCVCMCVCMLQRDTCHYLRHPIPSHFFSKI